MKVIWGNNAENFDLHFPITKSEKMSDGRLMVEGIATNEAVDNDGEIVDYESAKDAITKWKGNIREQHDMTKAVGKAVEVTADDVNKTIYLKAFISKGAQGTQDKILDGTLTGFSVGGSVASRTKEVVKADGKDIEVKRLKVKRIAEVSVVDSACNPTTTFQLVKADGESLVAVGVEEPAETKQVWTCGNKEHEHLAKADAVKCLEASEVLAKGGPGSGPKKGDSATKKAAEEYNQKSKDLEKSRAEIASKLADKTGDSGDHLIAASYHQTIAENSNHSSEDREKAKASFDRHFNAAKEKSFKSDSVTNLVKTETFEKGLYSVTQLAQVLAAIADLAQSAIWEAQSEGDNSSLPEALKNWLSQGSEILKAMTKEELDELVAGLNTMKTAQATDLKKAVKPEEPNEEFTKALKVVDELKDELRKSSDVLVKANNTIDELNKRVKHLEDQPALPKGFLKAIGKADDSDSGDGKTVEVAPVMKSDGKIDEEATAIKKAMTPKTFRKI